MQRTMLLPEQLTNAPGVHVRQVLFEQPPGQFWLAVPLPAPLQVTRVVPPHEICAFGVHWQFVWPAAVHCGVGGAAHCPPLQT